MAPWVLEILNMESEGESDEQAAQDVSKKPAGATTTTKKKPKADACWKLGWESELTMPFRYQNDIEKKEFGEIVNEESLDPTAVLRVEFKDKSIMKCSMTVEQYLVAKGLKNGASVQSHVTAIVRKSAKKKGKTPNVSLAMTSIANEEVEQLRF